MKLSIVIPVYNVAPYVRACIASIANQILDGVEIIAVNDGSADDSLEILREYEQRYRFLKVIDQPNAGVSVARNAGIEAASGEWLTFMDADDAYVDGAISYLLEVIENTKADMVCFDKISVEDQNSLVQLQRGPVKLFDLSDRDQAMAVIKSIYPIACNCCYRKSTCGLVRFIPGLHASEDVVYGLTSLFASKHLEVHETKLYKYYQRPNSCVHTISEKRIRGDIDSAVCIFEETKKWKWYEDCKKVIFRKVRICAIGCAAGLIWQMEENRQGEWWRYFFDRLMPVFTSKGFVPIWQKGIYFLVFKCRSPFLVRWMLYQPYRLVKFALTNRILLAFWKKIR